MQTTVILLLIGLSFAAAQAHVVQSVCSTLRMSSVDCYMEATEDYTYIVNDGSVKGTITRFIPDSITRNLQRVF